VLVTSLVDAYDTSKLRAWGIRCRQSSARGALACDCCVLDRRRMRLLDDFSFSRNNARLIRIFVWFSCEVSRGVTMFGSAYGTVVELC
jgi:hypothetical protein